MGGDEFAVLAIGATDDTLGVLLARLWENVETFNNLNTQNYTVSLSVGISRHDPQNPSSLDDLIAQADMLMYQEKRNKPLCR
jgi:diguanylate cyclase (GGDEF)-like protein